MRKNLRYFIVVLCGLAVIGAVLLFVRPEVIVNEQKESTEEVESFSVTEADPTYAGNKEGTTEKPTETEAMTTEAPVEEPEELSVSEITGKLPEASGLRKYFRGKLIINLEKVPLYLNVREAPNNDSPILAILVASDTVEYLRKIGSWYEVQMDGFTGYVHAYYVLTDDEAYEKMKDSVAYAVMAKRDSTLLYSRPDKASDPILASAKSEVFRVVSMTEDWYEVKVTSPIYKTLFIPKEDALIYYLFLGIGNDNELEDSAEEALGQLEISENLKRSVRIREEAEEEKAEYLSALASFQEASSAAEASYLASLEADKWAKAWEVHQAEQKAQQKAKESGEAQYIGLFRITYYCHCTKCCLAWGNDDPNYQAHGESGMNLVEDYTVAVDPNQIPFGTRLLVDGVEMIAADSGVPAFCIDVYRRTHEHALEGGMHYAEVYVLP